LIVKGNAGDAGRLGEEDLQGEVAAAVYGRIDAIVRSCVSATGGDRAELLRAVGLYIT